MARKRIPTSAAGKTELHATIQEVSSTALEHLANLLPVWLPGGRMEGQEYVCASLNGGQGRSCKINLNTGRWADFATDDKGGDPVSLYAAIQGLCQTKAAKELSEALGIVPDGTTTRLSLKLRQNATSSFKGAEKLSVPVPHDAPPPPNTRRYNKHNAWITQTVAARWAYRNEQGQLLGYVCRFNLPGGIKEIIPQVYGNTNGKTFWQWKSFPAPRPLYRLERLAASSQDVPVLICEGEKTADAAQSLLPYSVATTWPGGSKAARKTDFSPLAGRKVIIWPDADKCGWQAAMDVAQILETIGTYAQIVLPPDDAKCGWDLADAQSEGWSTGEVTWHMENNTFPLSIFKEHAILRFGINNKKQNPQIKPRPLIRIEKGALGATVDACEAILAESNLPIEYRIFQRGGQLVHLGELPISAHGGYPQHFEKGMTIMEVKKGFLLDVLSRHATFENKDRQFGEWRKANAPKDLADAILSRAGMWPMPLLRGILRCPTLREDGILLLKPGYDPQTHYYFDHNMNCEINYAPTKEEAHSKLDILTGLLSGFNFVAPEDRSVAIALILSAIAQPMLDHSPLFAITATVRGSGKSYLIDIISSISTGQTAPVLQATADKVEFEKCITSKLLSGNPFVSIDNYNGELQSNLLCQAITSERITVRPLGTSSQIEIPCTILWSANGNNLVLSGDLSRRALLCRLDPRCERPEERKFAFDPLQRIKQNRAEYVSAALTILRAYIIAGRPDLNSNPFGGFGKWSSLIRSAILWLEEPDPCASREAILNEDPQLAQLKVLLPLWQQKFGKKAVKIKELTAHNSSTTDELFEIIDDISGEGNGSINTRRLGHWLKRHKGRIVSNLKLVQFPGANMSTWQVVEASVTSSKLIDI